MIEQSIRNEILQLKKEKDVAILAHYYVDGEVQEIADYVGDSYYLAKKATMIAQENILFCGVTFMGESAKILNPQKKVYMADDSADCPMAHMADIEKIREVRREYNDVAVVCYVNSTTEIKAESDVCVTSSNALKIVRALPNKYIYLIPENQPSFLASSNSPVELLLLETLSSLKNGEAVFGRRCTRQSFAFYGKARGKVCGYVGGRRA